MARARVTGRSTAAAVFVGGCLGGALRLGIDAAVGTGELPWDIVIINVLGSWGLGVVAARVLVTGARWWTPGITTGLFGGFTTFSALTALAWSADAPAGLTIAVLLGTMAAAVAGAAVGWRIGSRDAYRSEP